MKSWKLEAIILAIGMLVMGYFIKQGLESILIRKRFTVLPLILFDTHTFEHQRQLQSSKLPSQSEFFVISKHFTATPRIPPASTVLKTPSINCNFTVEPQTFTTDLSVRLRSL